MKDELDALQKIMEHEKSQHYLKEREQLDVNGYLM